IGLGGGIIGDISGYAAALYMRGLNYIQVPTTLLSQVDSSIGSKVAINAYDTKNTIGTFYSPIAVIIDSIFLKRLTTRLFKEGLVELIKHGIIQDTSILDQIKQLKCIDELINNEVLITKLIKQSLQVKASIVQQDPLDNGLRHILNYGHTLAHALELSSTTHLYHGECVAIGILVNAYLNEDKDLYYYLKNLMEQLELLKPFPNIDLAKMIHDKKRVSQNIKEVFLEKLGAPYIEARPIDQLINQYEQAYQEVGQQVKPCPVAYIFKPVNLKGQVIIPPSKSLLHRYLIAAALSQETTILSGITSIYDDIEVTMQALGGLNAQALYDPLKQTITISKSINNKVDLINMKESGTSLRLLMPLLIHFNDEISITGENKLPLRPLKPYLDLFDEQGINYSFNETYLPITLSNKWHASTFKLPGNISSQFISGLLYTLPLLQGDSQIVLTSPLQSIPYVLMTLDTLADFNIKVTYNEDYSLFTIKGQQVYQSKHHYIIEQDYSSRGFFDVLKAMPQHDIVIENEITNTKQGDSIVLEVINNKDAVLDLEHVPDTAPIMAIYYALNGGKMLNTDRLAYKESDRLQAICDFLDTMNIKYDKIDNNINIIQGTINGGSFNTYHDHRITMALIVASTIATSPIIIDEVKSINKSFSTFLDLYEQCGGFINEK
ncbi:MAG: 3-dehydroquinate synthase family protein, partial [Bacilli bacterium]